MLLSVVYADAVSNFLLACQATCALNDQACLSNCNNLAADQQAKTTNATSMLFLTDCLTNCHAQVEMCRNTCISMDPSYRSGNMATTNWINNIPVDPSHSSTNGTDTTIKIEGNGAVLKVTMLTIVGFSFQ